MSLRAPPRDIASGQHSFFRKNAAAVASRWQHCVRFDSDLPLRRRTRFRSTNWPVQSIEWGRVNLCFPIFGLVFILIAFTGSVQKL